MKIRVALYHFSENFFFEIFKSIAEFKMSYEQAFKSVSDDL